MFFYVFLILGCSSHSLTKEKPIKRVALIIGNSDYKNNVLQNPINDAKGIAKTLKSIGFDVSLTLFNSTLEEFNNALAKLKSKVEPNNTILLIYFAGHGNTLKKGSNEQFLMMTDKEETTFVSIYKLYDFLNTAQARHNIMIIDACRDYQGHYVALEKGKKNYRGNFGSVTLRSTDGVKKSKPALFDEGYPSKFPRSTIVSYATDLYEKAKDWSIYDLHHSPYSYALINHLDDEEIPIEEVFRRVRRSLLKETEHKQGNTEKTTLEKNIWLLPKQANVAFTPPI